jgi:hypothetical protein
MRSQIRDATVRLQAPVNSPPGFRRTEHRPDVLELHVDPLTGLRARSPTDAGVPSRSGQALARDETRERPGDLA